MPKSTRRSRKANSMQKPQKTGTGSTELSRAELRQELAGAHRPDSSAKRKRK